MSEIEVRVASSENLRDPLWLLEAELREGEPLPEEFVQALRRTVREGEADVISVHATDSGEAVGAALVYYRLNLASGSRFASFEELHVAPESRSRGVGRELLEKVERRCSEKGISYIEAQIIAESVDFFLSAGYEAEPELQVLSRAIAFGD